MWTVLVTIGSESTASVGCLHVTAPSCFKCMYRLMLLLLHVKLEDSATITVGIHVVYTLILKAHAVCSNVL